MAKKHFSRETYLLQEARGIKSESLILLWGVILFLVVFLVTWGLPAHATASQAPTATDVALPMAKPAVPDQPIPFSHKVHMTFDMKCRECHPNPEPGDRMTLPQVNRCMECHGTIAKEKPAIQKLAEFAKSKQSIPWVRIYVVSGWVYWNHRLHLEAGMKCEMCHGEVSKMDTLTQATNVTTMAGCIDCHRKNDASTGCQYCHSGK